MTTNDGCRADVRKARAEAAEVKTRLTTDERALLTDAFKGASRAAEHLAFLAAPAVERILADRLATDTAAPEGGCVPCRVCGGSQTRGWHKHDATAPVAVEGVETVETLAEVLTDLRVPNPLASGADNDMEMSGIYDWDELQRFAAALEPILAARIVQARAGEGALREQVVALAADLQQDIEDRREDTPDDDGSWPITRAEWVGHIAGLGDALTQLRAALTTADPS